MCPRCRSSQTSRRGRRTSAGYRTFACRECGSTFNERTGTPFNDLQYPTDVVMLAVLWRLRYKLSFRDIAEMLLERGFELTHETVREWEFRFAPLLAEVLRANRRGRAGVSWYLDETYVKVSGALVLSVPSRRSPRRPHRLDAERTPRQACRASVPTAAARSRRG